jgi:hypothetical protein
VPYAKPLLFAWSLYLLSQLGSTVDAAAADRDSAKRAAYVAAFAMSNYSSTIGRIAKVSLRIFIVLTL